MLSSFHNEEGEIMLNIYDLYDLSAIFKTIRAFPEYELNEQVILKIIFVLENGQESSDTNQFRTALRSIHSLDKDKFYFVDVENVYVYFPAFLKDEFVYKVLIEACKVLLEEVKQKEKNKIEDLADCLHNLPILIVNNAFTIPKSFWEHEVKHYRDRWDKNFLKNQHN